MKQTVYTASPESQQIHVWRLNTEGSLTLVQVVDVRAVQPMVVSRINVFFMSAYARNSACWHTASPRMTAR